MGKYAPPSPNISTELNKALTTYRKELQALYFYLPRFSLPLSLSCSNLTVLSR